MSDLRARARGRIPHFAFEYLDSGTGSEAAHRRNRARLDEVLFLPSVLHGPQSPDLRVNLLGSDLAYPFGIAPVGMSGLMWPDAERILARAAARAGIPYCLSTVATRAPEDLAPVLGPHGWFQLYPPKDPAVLADMLDRVRKAGFTTLVLTVDVPVASRRERQVRSGLTYPPVLSPRILAQIARRPAWALATLPHGRPRMRTLDRYMVENRSLPVTEHIGYLLRASPDLDYLRRLRAAWQGPLIVKGVMDAMQAKTLEFEGVDAIWVSNHAGRQFDGTPAAIEVLPAMRAAVSLPIVFDSGIEGGLDILRALALGADFVMLGRAWHYAVAALGAKGPGHLVEILSRDLIANLGQIGVERFADLPARLVAPPS